MKGLCSKADVIVPNITETALMLGVPYKEGPYTRAYIEDMLRGLSALGPKLVVLTGVYFDEENLGAASYDRRSGEIYYAFDRRIQGDYHGTGDMFASALTACLLSGGTPDKAVKTAVNFTAGCIKRTKDAGTDVRFGVNFEEGLKELAEIIEKL